MTHGAPVPEGWSQTTLGQVARYVNGRAFKPAEWGTVGRPIIRIQNLTGSTDVVNRYDGAVDSKHIVHAGDLLLSWAATLGVFVWQGEEAALNQHIFKVHPNVDPRFMYYLLQHTLGALKSQVHGTGMQHITKGRFEATAVAIPRSREEQERIAVRLDELLSDMDAADKDVSLVSDALAGFRAHVLRAAFQPDNLTCSDEWLGQFGDTAGDCRCPVVPLSTVLKWASGDGLPEKARRGGSVPVYGGNGISGWHDEAMTEEPAIVIGRVGYYCGNVHVTDGIAWITDNCIRSTWRDPRANLAFFAYWLESKRLNRQSAGTRQKYINQTVLKNLDAPFPEERVQLRVVAEVEAALSLLEGAAALLRAAEAQSTALRRSVLKSAFSGQLV